MLLSFWDTYWNDSIIPERFEERTSFNRGCFSLEVESPGIKNETEVISGVNSNEDYGAVINAYQEEYLHFKLLKLGEECLTSFNCASLRGLCYSDYEILYSYVLRTLCGLEDSDFAVVADFERVSSVLNDQFIFAFSSKYEICPNGSYKVAVWVCEDGYESWLAWLRQNADGTWSYKIDGGPISNRDDSNNLIYDPEHCYIDSATEFLGFYSATPWGMYYE